jgi:ABC-type lipoprotein export system ATPase subunit
MKTEPAITLSLTLTQKEAKEVLKYVSACCYGGGSVLLLLPHDRVLAKIATQLLKLENEDEYIGA